MVEFTYDNQKRESAQSGTYLVAGKEKMVRKVEEKNITNKVIKTPTKVVAMPRKKVITNTQ